MSQEMLDRILNAVVDLKVNMAMKFEHIEERFKGIDVRLDRSEERFSNIEIRLDAVERRLYRVELRLDKVEQKLDEKKSAFENIKTAVLEIGRSVNGHNDRINALVDSNLAVLDQVNRSKRT